MKHFGNYKEWINPELINYILENKGEEHPKTDPQEYGKENNVSKLKDLGYKFNRTYWYSFEKKTLPFDVTLPFDLGKNTDWWFVKLLPGNLIPLHKDHNHSAFSGSRCIRYWMPLQDYIRGHIFINENQMITNYKAGDVFEYDQDAMHTALNLNRTIPRLPLNFVRYEEINNGTN